MQAQKYASQWTSCKLYLFSKDYHIKFYFYLGVINGRQWFHHRLFHDKRFTYQSQCYTSWVLISELSQHASGPRDWDSYQEVTHSSGTPAAVVSLSGTLPTAEPGNLGVHMCEEKHWTWILGMLFLWGQCAHSLLPVMTFDWINIHYRTWRTAEPCSLHSSEMILTRQMKGHNSFFCMLQLFSHHFFCRHFSCAWQAAHVHSLLDMTGIQLTLAPVKVLNFQNEFRLEQTLLPPPLYCSP